MFKANMGRPVEVKDPDKVKGEDGQWKSVPRVRQGKFHVWGFQRCKDRVSGALMMQTVGIVEVETGKCKQFLPEQIRFLDLEQRAEQ